MSAEQKYCKNCKLGEIIKGGNLNLPIQSAIPLSVFIAPKITRRCLSKTEVVVDRVASFIENGAGVEIAIDRIEENVPFSAPCVKPNSYTPKEENTLSTGPK